MHLWNTTSRLIAASALAFVPGIVSCTPTTFLNNTASLGGTTPGSRGTIEVSFINKTPFRAIFTFGSYDPQNFELAPQFRQFRAVADATQRLEGNSEAGPFPFTCGRAFSLGGDQLIQFIKDKGLDVNVSEAALQPGITFSDRPLDDPDAEQPTAGRATGVVTIQGAEFPCSSGPPNTLIVYTLELDAAAPEGFRISTQVFPGG